jgi:hypothetical protein
VAIEEVLALLCETRLATMSELLALEGPWSVDLLATMAGEAMRIQARNKKEVFVGQVAAISTFFGGGEFSRDYAATLDKAAAAIERVRASRMGEEPETELEAAADKLEEILSNLPGMKG